MKAQFDQSIAARAQPPAPPIPPPLYPPPTWEFNVDDVVSAIEPELCTMLRDDVQIALSRIHSGVEHALDEQSKRLVSAVWKQLQPALQLLETIYKEFGQARNIDMDAAGPLDMSVIEATAPEASAEVPVVSQ